MRKSTFPSTICGKDCPFSTEWSWHTCQKIIWPYLQEFISGLCSSSLAYVCFRVSTTLCSFVVNLKSGIVSPTILFFYFRIVLALEGSLRLYMNLGMEFSTSAPPPQKKVFGILIGITLICRLCWNLNNIKSWSTNVGCLSIYLGL